MINTKRIYSRSFTIPQNAIDENGHVNNVAYVQWMHAESVLPSNIIHLGGYISHHNPEHGIYPCHERDEPKGLVTSIKITIDEPANVMQKRLRHCLPRFCNAG